MLKPEQYNLLAQHISQTGNAIVRNTDLISELPTQKDLEKILTDEVRYRMFRIEDIVKNGQEVIESSIEDKLSKQTEFLMKAIDRKISEVTSELKAKDLTPWKLKLKWGGGWSDIAVNGLYLAADLAMIGSTDNEEFKPKYVRERKYGQKKKKQDEQSQDEGYEMKM